MPAAPETMTARQQAWMARVKENLVKQTGRTLEEWAVIARGCPESKHRARLSWMKTLHGLGQNRASVILDLAFPSNTSWDRPDALAETLWSDPAARVIFDAVKAEITALHDVVIGQRKTYTAFSRAFQFAAVRPSKGTLILGLAVPPDERLGLMAPKRAIWSERLKSQATLSSTADLPSLVPALRQGWEAS